MYKSGDKGPVPPRWLNCPRKANELVGSKLMAFKTPLNHCFDDKVPPENRFHPKMLFEICKSKKIKFGLWIDLTNTNRFYDKKEIEENDCRYVKLPCRGHGQTPTREQTNMFIKLVTNFIAQNPLQCIAVHCTHGFNRSGFLIVSYLVEAMDCSLDTAMAFFAKARPPGIYKADYVKELYSIYEPDEDEIPPAPPLPNWCFEDEDNPDCDDSVLDRPETSDSSKDKNYSNNEYKKKGRNGKKAEFMAGVLGVYEFTEQPKAFNLQKKIQAMCGWKGRDFPGCQPISMDLNNLKLLHLKPYRVSWKADGTRYMMLIDGQDEVYFFDRNNSVFLVKGLRFPQRKDLRKHISNTLLDGEMVIDIVNGTKIPRYLVYDCIHFGETKVYEYPFYPTRLQYIENEVIKPRYAAMEANIINKTLEPFSIRNKQFWDINQAGSLLGEKFAATLCHEPDGLIFQPSKEKYQPGRCDEVLKWKPLSLNSVDFRLKIVKVGGMGKIEEKEGHLFVGQKNDPVGKIKITNAIKNLDGKIIECKFESGQWKFMRERTDKPYPNSLETAKAVVESIMHPVTKEILLNYIQDKGFQDDSDKMPPPSKRIRR